MDDLFGAPEVEPIHRSQQTNPMTTLDDYLVGSNAHFNRMANFHGEDKQSTEVVEMARRSEGLKSSYWRSNEVSESRLSARNRRMMKPRNQPNTGAGSSPFSTSSPNNPPSPSMSCSSGSEDSGTSDVEVDLGAVYLATTEATVDSVSMTLNALPLSSPISELALGRVVPSADPPPVINSTTHQQSASPVVESTENLEAEKFYFEI
jgi:hypothetical protein